MRPILLLSLAASLFPTFATAQAAKMAKPIQVKAIRVNQKSTGVSGVVTKDGLKATSFTMGVKDKGRIVVDTSGARFRWRNGQSFDRKRLVGGAMVSVVGEQGNGRIRATLVTVNHLPSSKPTTKVAKPSPVKSKR